MNIKLTSAFLIDNKDTDSTEVSDKYTDIENDINNQNEKVVNSVNLEQV